MAKDLVRTRRYVKKFILMRANIQAVSLKIQTLRSNNAMAQAMKGVTRAMQTMNRQVPFFPWDSYISFQLSCTVVEHSLFLTLFITTGFWVNLGATQLYDRSPKKYIIQKNVQK